MGQDTAIHTDQIRLYDTEMASPDQQPQPGSEKSPRFHTTRWSVVLAAGDQSAPDAHDALSKLCEIYWYPLYAYVRRKGHSANDAQDLTQEFFARLLEKNIAGEADRARGKFRSFLLASLNHFLANEWRAASAQKRNAGRPALSLDLAAGESRYALEPAHELTAEKIFQRRWALTLLDQTIARLRDEFVANGRLDLFEHLLPYLGGGDNGTPYRQIATELGKTEGAIKVAIHRLRQRCRELLRAEIGQTVSGQGDIDEELRDLFDAVER
jgi:RNA polymerase sigma-70 factor (ECF subfamily)